MITIGQNRISDTWVGNTEAAEMLGTHPTNAKKVISLGLTPRTLEVEALVDEQGQVVALRTPVGAANRRAWMYRREGVEQIRKRRAGDVKRRAADAKRRETARAKVAT